MRTSWNSVLSPRVRPAYPCAPRADSDIPKDPGYCFAGRFIANPGWRNEEATIDIAGHPDACVTVTIYPLAAHKKDQPLLERMGGLAGRWPISPPRYACCARASAASAPYQRQEHLASIPGSTGAHGHAFVWETQGDGTLDTPR
jgi:hypothetical protein